MALNNDDLFLVNDSQDGNNAKKIKYSTLKTNIATDVGASDLQAVTDAGNTTTNLIEAGAGVKVSGGSLANTENGMYGSSDLGSLLMAASPYTWMAPVQLFMALIQHLALEIVHF